MEAVFPVFGDVAFAPELTPEFLYRGAQEARQVPDIQEAVEGFAFDLATIRALPEYGVVELEL